MKPSPFDTTEAPHASRALWLPYVAPLALFLAFTALEGYALKAYVWLYLAKAGVVTASLLYFRTPLQDIRFDGRALIAGLLVGLAVFAEWILLDKWVPYPHFGSRAAFNPFTAIESPGVRALFLAVRLYGLVLMVPVMEEIFWRSFLLRYLTSANFAALAMGTFSLPALGIAAAAFAMTHTEWLVAFICACAYSLLLRQTRSLFACIVAHGVTNLALGVYILLTQDWRYW